MKSRIRLRATLSDDEKALAAAKPTRNPDAYVFYLRANQISRNPDTLLEDYKTAEQLYMQAIELDPNFALAHARLASVCAEVFRYYEPTESWRTKARAEAEAALRLQPNLAEGHFALGQCIYWMDQDYDKALEQFEIASRLSPSNADTRRLIAAIERRQGKWQAGARSLRTGCEARSAKSEHCSRTYVYELVNAAMAGSGALGRANARLGSDIARGQNPKRLRQFSMERRHSSAEVDAG